MFDGKNTKKAISHWLVSCCEPYPILNSLAIQRDAMITVIGNRLPGYGLQFKVIDNSDIHLLLSFTAEWAR
jgi:hypothetical protein